MDTKKKVYYVVAGNIAEFQYHLSAIFEYVGVPINQRPWGSTFFEGKTYIIKYASRLEEIRGGDFNLVKVGRFAENPNYQQMRQFWLSRQAGNKDLQEITL